MHTAAPASVLTGRHLIAGRWLAPAGRQFESRSPAHRAEIIGTFPESTHPPIVYPVALTANATHPDAAAFLAYVRSATARPLFEAQGFTVLSLGQS